MKKITKEQIDGILQMIYVTNIPVSQFDAIRKTLLELPEIEDEKNN